LSSTPPRSVGGRVAAGIRTLDPGCFAVVMATGIVSVGLDLEHHGTWSAVLRDLAVALLAVLLVLTAWRVVVHPHDTARDLEDPRRSFGFFTLVAGLDVVAARLALDGHITTTAVLLGAATALWLLLGYAVPWLTALASHRDGASLVGQAQGSWFTWVVGSQSVAVVAAGLEPAVRTGRAELALLAVGSWSVGVFLYAAVAVLVMLRLVSRPLRPEELTAPYWVSMGACAITVLAGARVVEMAGAPVVAPTHGLVAALAVVFWAFGTWLVPALVAAGWWRHVVHRVPLRYDAGLWSMVFPLGMYAAASIYLGRAGHLPLVEHLGTAELWVAVAVYAATLAAMAVHLVAALVLGRDGTAAGTPTRAAEGGRS
jgi:tellurite resistance protein TehA-like permease